MHEKELKQLKEKLREDGVRMTTQRIAILDYLAEAHHPTAEDIYTAIVAKDPNISMATVYNNLNKLTEEGYLLELTYGDDASRYDFNIGKHYHVVCQECGCVEDLFYPLLEDVESVAEELTGYKVLGHRMEVFGVCPKCQQNYKM